MLQVLAPLTVLLLAGPPGEVPVGEGPSPSATPISWELEFKFLDPRRIEVQLPGEAEPEVFWYMVYTVTNTSRRAQRFFPLFQIVTEDLTVHTTDIGINPLVFESIRERHAETHPYLVHPTKAIGALLHGTDNARESVAIWRQIDLSENNFRVYVAGLSGETRFVPNPAFDPTKPATDPQKGVVVGKPEPGTNPEHFTLRKTLAIEYTLPGSPIARPATTPQRGEIEWVMR